MKRRKFLQTGGAALGVPAILNGFHLTALAKPFLFSQVETQRKLVLIQLNGGNDGLSMLVPTDQYANLRKVRQEVLVPASKILPITDTLGFHSSMGAMQELYKEGRMGIIQSVGYPDQNRSHFRSMDIWTTGSPAKQFWDTGWLGRYLDDEHPGYPQSYPNQEHKDPFAISMGYNVSKTCQGSAANISFSLNDPFSLRKYPEMAGDDTANTRYGEELDYLRSTMSQTNSYGNEILKAAEGGRNTVEYPDTELGEQLKNVALLISGGLKTKIYVVSLGGFDTHAGQVEDGSPETGVHAELLQTLSTAMASFAEDMKKQNLDSDVLGMTFSEFGRQIASNANRGTDHGTAAPLLLFGSCLDGKILGTNPEIPAQPEKQEGVPMQFDFRDVYGSVFMDWFGVPEQNVQKLLYGGFTYLPILKDCRSDVTTSSRDTRIAEFEVQNYPNPFRDGTMLTFNIPSREPVRISLFDALGHELRTLVNKTLDAGRHEFFIDGHNLPAGSYFYRLMVGDIPVTGRMIKVR